MSNDKWTNFFRCCFVLNVCICALSRSHLWKALTYSQSIAIHHSERNKDGRNARMRQRAREHYQLTCLYVQTFLLFSSIALYTNTFRYTYTTHTERIVFYIARTLCGSVVVWLYLSVSICLVRLSHTRSARYAFWELHVSILYDKCWNCI